MRTLRSGDYERTFADGLRYGPYQMPDTLDASQYEFPLATLIDAIGSTEAESKWAKLQSAQERAIAALENRRAELNSLYKRAVAPDTSWEEIAQVASMIGEWGRVAAEKLYPQIGALQQKLAAPHNDMRPEVRRARQESVKVAEGWLALYRDLRNKLRRLAAERRPADVVLLARPVAGETDYAELSREHIARYPKIRAALAE
jgi:acyl carrier protein phosphodiesterase